jgi:KDO2-lipid IV(A) lauroyltransferase
VAAKKTGDRRMFSYYLMKLLSALACALPRHAADSLGWCLGRLAWPLVPKRRKELAFQNVRRCLGCNDEEAWRIARQSSVRFGPMLMEVLRFPVIKKHIRDYVSIDGLPYLQKALAQGKGGIIATIHSGNWELMGGAFALAGIPLVGVAQKQKSAGMDRFIVEYRTLIGMHITYKKGVREMFAMMAKNYMIGLIDDQDPAHKDGVLVEFFGQPTNHLTGPASMARFRDVPIFPAFMHRDDATGTHKLIVYPPVFVKKTRDKREDIRRTIQALARMEEAHVRKYPEEWFWLHDRWKSVRQSFTKEELDEYEHWRKQQMADSDS